MAYSGNSILAVVPARGGSKGIPKKNIADLNGKPLIAYTADLLNKVELIDRAVVSTDDCEIKKVAEEYNLDVPFLRPEQLAQDTSLTIDVLRHAHTWCKENYNIDYDIVVLLEPTSPLRTAQDILSVVNLLINDKYDSVLTVSKSPASTTPEKTLIVRQRKVGFFHENGQNHSIRQTIPPYYHRNGLCYAILSNKMYACNDLITDNTGCIITSRPVVNIDHHEDMLFARFLLNEFKGQREHQFLEGANHVTA